jgi:hypothetical protein
MTLKEPSIEKLMGIAIGEECDLLQEQIEARRELFTRFKDLEAKLAEGQLLRNILLRVMKECDEAVDTELRDTLFYILRDFQSKDK